MSLRAHHRNVEHGGSTGISGRGCYAVSDAGLHGRVRTIAIEDSSHGITAYCILPKMLATSPAHPLRVADSERIKAALVSGRFDRSEEEVPDGVACSRARVLATSPRKK